MPEDGSPRILISRMSAIGDCILTLPTLCALRRAFPAAFIAWVVQPAGATLLQGHDCLDAIVVVPRNWYVRPRGIIAARRTLRPLHPTIAIDAQSMTKSALAARLSGARVRIGISGAGHELAPWLDTKRVRVTKSHLVDRTLELLQPLDIDPATVDVEYRIPRDRAADLMATGYLDSAGLQPGRFAVINPGASWPSKLWEMDRYAEVARHLKAAHGVSSVVVWAGDKERQSAGRIVADSGGAARIAPATSLPELAALFRTARLFVGSDTGPMHLSVAVGTPTICLHGPTRPADSGPYGAPHIALQERYHSGTRRERRRANNDAMRLITVPAVCDATDQLLATDPPDREHRPLAPDVDTRNDPGHGHGG
jgi:lipopolysaccharide heptosyltransferase I